MASKKLSEEISCKEETCIQKTNIALFKLTMDNIENNIKNLSDKMDKFIDSADNKYASKVEHLQNQEKIDKIENVLSKLNWIIISSVVIALLTIIIKN